MLTFPFEADSVASLLLSFVSWLAFTMTLLLFALAQEIGPVVWAVWLSALLLATFVLAMAWARRMKKQMVLGHFLLAATRQQVDVECILDMILHVSSQGHALVGIRGMEHPCSRFGSKSDQQVMSPTA